MKANAPEKIYVHIKYKPCEITFSEVIEKDCSNIEYIRKDAFIEKAEEYLYKQLNEGSMECGDIETFIEQFKKYMKESV